jgi:hypothetical protein
MWLLTRMCLPAGRFSSPSHLLLYPSRLRYVCTTVGLVNQGASAAMPAIQRAILKLARSKPRGK